ncbi:MAG: hypothetical protein JWO36_2880 [Myxococcales bacterium]|nr:hypothetical protein [Myxococcales bacterium]
MNTTLVIAIAIALRVIAACGDNSKACGPGTVDIDGTCTPDECGPGTKNDGTNQCVPDGAVICTDGTKLDVATQTCKIDPAVCQDGTALVNGACIDTGHIHADIEEGPEPNGLGLLGETSASPAGTIVLPPVGTGFVIHGLITPFEDNDNDGQDDADVDAYRITVSGPSLLHISADGLHGLAAGFVVAAEVGATDPLARWRRLGVNFEGDTSQRQVLLPRAGTYLIGIADTRSLLLRAAAGNTTTEYYVTIDALEMPAPAAIVLGQGVVGSITENVRLYAPGPLGTGTTTLHLDVPLPAAQGSLVVFDGTTFVTFGDEGAQPATVTFTDPPGSQTMIAVDFVVDYALEPADFTLTGTTTP